MVRAVYQLLNAGVGWHSLTAAQQRRYERDAYFTSSAGDGCRHIRVPQEDRFAARAYVRSRSTHRERLAQNGFHARSLSSASAWSYRLGNISVDEHKKDKQIEKLNGAYKHDKSKFPPLPQKARQWADVEDDDFEVDNVKESGTGGKYLPSDGDGFSRKQEGSVVGYSALSPSCLELPTCSAFSTHIQNGGEDVVVGSLPGGGFGGGMLRDQVAKLQAENAQVYNEVAKLRNENYTLYDSSTSLQQELSVLQAQLSAAESAMGVWASHAMALEDQLFVQRRHSTAEQLQDESASSRYIGMGCSWTQGGCGGSGQWGILGPTVDGGSGGQRGGEPQSLGVYGHLQSGSGSEFRIGLNPCSSPCSQLQCVPGSELRIEAVFDEKLAAVNMRVDKLTKSLGENVQRSVDKRSSEFLTAVGLQHQLDELEQQLASKFVMVDGLEQQLQCSHEQLGVLLTGQVKTANADMIENIVDKLRSEFVGRDSFASDISKLQEAVGRQLVAKDAMVQKQCEDLKQTISQLAESLACSRDDGDKGLAQLWEAFDILKSEVKELLRRHSSSVSTGAASTSSSLTGHASPEVGSVTVARPIRVGDTVCTHSLSFLALNDKVGIVVGYNKTRKRYAVSLASEDGQIADKLFKAENLQLCDSHGSGSHNAVGDELDLERQVERAEVAASYKSIDDLLSKSDLYTGNDVDILSLLSQHEFIQSERAMGRAAGDPEAIIDQSLRVYMEQFVKTKTIVTKKFFSRLDEPSAVSRDEEHVNCSSSSDAHLVDSSF